MSRFTDAAPTQADRELDDSLRPSRLNDFIGQTRLKENLAVFIQAAKTRGEALDHILFCGPPGLGKTTLANIIASELGVTIRTSSGPVIEKPGDLAGILTNLQPHDLFFIDEIHRLGKVVEEYLYPAMEDFVLDIVIDKGPAARTIRLNLPGFTLVGATTRAGLLSSPMRTRFGMVFRLDYYSPEDLAVILTRSARILNIELDPAAGQEIARRARGTPRVANRLLRRTRDFAQVIGDGRINLAIARHALQALEVDDAGLDEMDKKILGTIIDKFNGGPVGINTIAQAVSEDPGTLEEVYEPYLVQQGFLNRTSRGRQAMPKAFRHLGRALPVGLPEVEPSSSEPDPLIQQTTLFESHPKGERRS